jgi:hypothetical protein
MNTYGVSPIAWLTNLYHWLRQTLVFLIPSALPGPAGQSVPSARSAPWTLHTGTQAVDFDNRPGLVIY